MKSRSMLVSRMGLESRILIMRINGWVRIRIRIRMERILTGGLTFFLTHSGWNRKTVGPRNILAPFAGHRTANMAGSWDTRGHQSVVVGAITNTFNHRPANLHM